MYKKQALFLIPFFIKQLICLADYYVPSNLETSDTIHQTSAYIYQLSTSGEVKKKINLSTSSEVTSIIQSNQTLYITGCSEVNDTSMPTLWISDLMLNKIRTITIGDAEGAINGILLSDRKIFLVGRDQNQGAIIWIVDLQGRLISSTPITSNPISYASKIIKVNNRLYVTGSNASCNDIPTLWICDMNGKHMKSITLDESEQKNAAGPIVSISNRIFILDSFSETSFNNAFSIWMTDEEGVVLKTITLGNSSEFIAENLIKKEDQLIVVGGRGSNENSLQPTVWTFDDQGNLLSTSSFGEPGSLLSAGIFLGEQLITVGTRKQPPLNMQFWKILSNGNIGLSTFFGEGYPVDIINSISDADSISRASSKFSTIKNLKGVH